MECGVSGTSYRRWWRGRRSSKGKSRPVDCRWYWNNLESIITFAPFELIQISILKLHFYHLQTYVPFLQDRAECWLLGLFLSYSQLLFHRFWIQASFQDSNALTSVCCSMVSFSLSATTYWKHLFHAYNFRAQSCKKFVFLHVDLGDKHPQEQKMLVYGCAPPQSEIDWMLCDHIQCLKQHFFNSEATHTVIPWEITSMNASTSFNPCGIRNHMLYLIWGFLYDRVPSSGTANHPFCKFSVSAPILAALAYWKGREVPSEGIQLPVLAMVCDLAFPTLMGSLFFLVVN